MPYNYNNYGYSGYTSPYNRQYQQMPVQQPMQQPQPQVISPSDLPISELRYATDAEATNYLVDIGRKIMFIDKNAKICTIKWSDSLGNCGMQKFKFENYNEPKNEAQNAPIDTSNFLTKKDVGEFATKDDLKAIYDQISNIQKKVRLNKMLEDENTNVQK